MLTQVPVTPTKRTIALLATDSATVYTVPYGKTFTGYVYFSDAADILKINTVAVTGTTVAGSLLPLTLQAGDVVASGATTAFTLVGVEQ